GEAHPVELPGPEEKWSAAEDRVVGRVGLDLSPTMVKAIAGVSRGARAPQGPRLACPGCKGSALCGPPIHDQGFSEGGVEVDGPVRRGGRGCLGADGRSCTDGR